MGIALEVTADNLDTVGRSMHFILWRYSSFVVVASVTTGLVANAAAIQHVAAEISIAGAALGFMLGWGIIQHALRIRLLGAVWGALASLQFVWCSPCDGSTFSLAPIGAFLGWGAVRIYTAYLCKFTSSRRFPYLRWDTQGSLTDTARSRDRGGRQCGRQPSFLTMWDHRDTIQDVLIDYLPDC